MDWFLGNVWYTLLLLLIPVLGWVVFSFLKWRRDRKSVFAEAKFHDQLFPPEKRFSKVFPMLYLLATLFLIFAIIDVLRGREEVAVQQKVNNIIYMLDVSNSMNTQDIEPSRLQTAKNIILNSLQNLNGDRVGIVVFAGDAFSVMPLTTDYSTAENYISGIETSVVGTQGTDFLKGMKVSAEKFKNVAKGSRTVFLISDGEDNEGNHGAAINEAKKQGISVISIGVGTEEGAPIPEYYFGQLMGYKSDISGETVISKRQTDALKQIAASTGGTYIDGNDIEFAVNELDEALKSHKSGSSTMIKSQNSIHYYQYFLGVSIILFLTIFLFNPKRDFNI